MANVVGAKSGAAGADFGPSNPDIARADDELRNVIEAWPDLPEAIRASILTMVTAATAK